jgi:hypothetical protein
MAKRPTTQCDICGKHLANSGFERHRISCDMKSKAPPPPEKRKGFYFDHKLGEYVAKKQKIAWNKGKSKETDPILMQASETLKARFANGELTPTGFCADDYDNERRIEAGKKSGGYRENAGYSKKFYISDSFGTRTCLQSSHELALSEMLNERGIIWRREGCFWYDDKRYFPDFYLVDFDIYLDVKNEYLIKIDAEKIAKVIEQNKGIKLEVFTLAAAEEFLNQL